MSIKKSIRKQRDRAQLNAGLRKYTMYIGDATYHRIVRLAQLQRRATLSGAAWAALDAGLDALLKVRAQ
jgi:hypothetical protein